MIETDKLILREFEEQDAQKVFENFAGIEKIAEISDFKVHVNVEETKQIINYGLGDKTSECYASAIILKEINEPIGFIRVFDGDYINKTCKITWALGEKWWNKGYTSEALKEVIKYIFEVIEFNVISCEFDSNLENTYKKILEQSGMKEEARLKNRKLNSLTGEKYDKIIYSIFKEEYC